MRLGAGLTAGAAIVFVDNFAFGGEVSPIVIVVLLLVATCTATGHWGRHGWITAGLTWVCVPLAHLVKHACDLPDTLHPNTYASIVLLAAFTAVVATLGAGSGMLVHGRGGR